MPLPRPTKREKENDFISRCMSNEVMKREFPNRDQRLAVCFDIFRKRKKK